MKKLLVVMVDPSNNQGSFDAGGLDLFSVAGVKEALMMAEFAQRGLTDRLVELRARELAEAADDE